MKWFGRLVSGAGLGHFNPAIILVLMLITSGFGGVLVMATAGLSGLALAAATLLFAGELELLLVLGRARRKAITVVFPAVIESLHSAVVSGLELNLAFQDIGRVGPIPVRQSFKELSSRIDAGYELQDTLLWLKNEFADSRIDQLCEYLLLSQDSGGVSLAENLETLSQRIRSQGRLLEQIAAKQGWVIGTAKLALVTPWLIVGLLALRPENSIAYSSSSGMLVLSSAVLLSLLAYLAITLMANLPQPKRVQLS